MATGDDKPDFFGMSDDDFLNVNPSSLEEGAPAPSANSDEPKVETTDDDAPVVDPVVDPLGSDTDQPTEAEKAAAVEAEDDPDKKGDEDDDNPLDKPDAEIDKAKPAEPDKAKADPAAVKVDPKDKADPAAEPAKVDAPAVERAPAKVLTTPEEFKGFYEQVMKPFKANGREITLRSPEEAIRLMQMGAGYGRKLQDMQPHLKTLRMLEKNDLLSDTKLSYLIDLDKKNPEAIKKLIKDSGIDPLDLNMDDNANYRPTNHSVTDTEVGFTEALKEVSALPGGPETIRHINKDWDQSSKDFLMANPSVLTVIQEQRENGIYTAIQAEIDRQKMLGDIKPSMPFLQAYKIAGDALVTAKSLPGMEANKQPDTTKTAPTPVAPKVDQPDTRILATRVAAPKSSATNTDKAKAAAAPTAGGKRAKATVNPLDMADDEFLKQFPL